MDNKRCGHSEATKEKIRQSMVRRWENRTDRQKAALSDLRSIGGYKRSEEAREALSRGAMKRQQARRERDAKIVDAINRGKVSPELYDKMSGQEVASANEFWEPTKLSETPTQTLAGTIDRAEVYRKRLEAKECLYHPEDTRDGDPSRAPHASTQPVSTAAIRSSFVKRAMVLTSGEA